MQQESVLVLSPSFSSYSSIGFAEIADKVVHEYDLQREDFGFESMKEPISISSNQITGDKGHEEKASAAAEIESEEDLEFSFVCRDHETVTISADDIFSKGQIRPIYPVFNKDIFGNHATPPPRWEEGDTFLGFPLREPETPNGAYCVCMPRKEVSLGKCNKSNSTGTSKQWKFRNLIRRSNSDSKETMVYLTRSETCPKKKVDKVEKKNVEPSKGKKISSERKVRRSLSETKGGSCQVVKSAHEIHYMRNRASKEADRRRSFLPYRRDLFGFFAVVSFFSRNIHPY